MLQRFVAHTFGLARWIPATPRQEEIQAASVRRAQRLIDEWFEEDPGFLVRVLGGRRP